MVHRYCKALPLMHVGCTVLIVGCTVVMTDAGCTKCAICKLSGILISGIYVCSRNAGPGASKYEGMRCISRCFWISGNPMMTSKQLSITLTSIHSNTLSDLALNRVKSNTTVPYTTVPYSTR